METVHSGTTAGNQRDSRSRTSSTTVSARVLPDGHKFEVTGRDAWALQNLMAAGPVGCTPIDTPGPRWSHYVWKLRREGLVIETIHEPHSGPFPGTHARYVLHTQVGILGEKIAA